MKEDIILIGGGGHCISCIDVIEQENKFNIAGVVDLNEISNVQGYKFLGGYSNLDELIKYYKYAFITFGQIKTIAERIETFGLLHELGFIIPSIISPKAYVSKNSKLGDGSIVMHGAIINSNAIIGKNCIVNTNSVIEHDSYVGNNCHISTGSIINGNCKVGEGSFIGSNATLVNASVLPNNSFIKAGSIYYTKR
jgi:sugar O-acyltransferase (sialic acid O-acetyltransferase NeuD family)